MASIDKSLIIKLRERTGCGMMACKNALEQADGDIEKAVDILRKKGADIASKRSGHEASQGIVASYIHPGDQIGVLIEIGCETDFVARTDDIKKFAHDVCLHIAAAKPLYLAQEDVDEKFIEHERSIIHAQLADSGKPDKMIKPIVEGKINKLYEDICLLKQSFVKNDQLTIEDVIKELVAKLGERIIIKRFTDRKSVV